MIGGFTLASWGTLGRFWETGEHNKRNFNVQAWIFTDFWLILMPMGVISRAWCLYFNILGRSWDDPGTLGSTRKDVVRSRLGFYRFLIDDLVEPFRKNFGYNWSEKHIFFASISRLSFLMFLGLESGCLGLEKTGICQGREVLQKAAFAEIGFLLIPVSIFHDFEGLWDQFS